MRRRSIVALAACFALTASLPPVLATAQEGGSAAAAVTLSPLGPAGVSGLAVLTPRGADTAANVVAIGAPAGAMVVVHAGTCEAIDPAPTGLLGDVGTTGQLAATVPLGFVAIADGGHVLAIHPGLDLTTTLACGAIPLVEVGPGERATPEPGATMPSTPAPIPTTDPTCAGLDAWVTATLARFDAVKAMGDDLTAAMNAGMAAYAQALADTSLSIQRLQIEQQQAPVPTPATAAQTAVIKMFQRLADAYDLMSQAYTTGDTAVLQQGLAAAGEAQSLATAARAAIRQASTPCNITVPVA